MSYEEIWQLGYKVMRGLASLYTKSMDQKAQELGLEAPTWYPLTAAYTFQPDPISVDRMRVRVPYASADYYEGPIRALVQAGCLVPSELGGYSLTEEGIQATRAIMAAAYEAMAQAPSLEDAEMKSLCNALGRLVQVCLVYGPAISKWSLIYSRRLDKAGNDAYMAKIDQYLSDLNSYRDDVHLAAWKHLEIDGHAWDVFSLVWREGAMELKAIREGLANRRWSQSKTEEALAVLREEGWVEEGEEIQLTELGSDIREVAEKRTDEYFYAPWDYADAEDLLTISSLLPELAAKLGID